VGRLRAAQPSPGAPPAAPQARAERL